MNKVKRVLFIYKIDLENESHLGIFNKLQNQKVAWQNQGYNVESITVAEVKKVTKIGTYSKFLDYHLNLFFFKYCHTVVTRIVDNLDYQFIFIRHIPLAIGLNRFLISLREKFPNAKIIVDLPTYPYIHEYKGLKKVLAQYLLPKNLSERCDFITHLGPEKVLFGVPVISIINSVDTSKFKLKTQFDKNLKTLKLISVSSLWRLLALPDLIIAIKRYNDQSKDKKIFLTIVGDGPQKKSLQDQVDSLQLTEFVNFTGFQYEDKLTQLINQNHMGVGVIINSESKNILYTQALKHRMFAAYGLPFFTNIVDPGFVNLNSILLLQDQSIDVKLLTKIFDWHLTNIPHYENITKDLRSFAEINLNEQINVKKILTFVEKLNN